MLSEAYESLFTTFGPQHWWPAETPFEVIVGAILTQNTNWRNVEIAIANLRHAEMLKLPAIDAMESTELEALIRPAGYYRVKTKRLKNVARFILENFRTVDAMFQTGTTELRQRLLMINGVGPETADSILLYAGNRPTFVVDAYTSRIAKRHAWVPADADYQTLKDFFETNLTRDVQLFNEYHALIVRVGKQYCKPTPNCEGCPLQGMLPESGIINF